MRKSMFGMLLSVFLVITVLAGCSSSPGTGGNNGSSDQDPDQAGQSADSEPGSIQVAYYADETARETFDQIIDQFMEENEHISVEKVGTDWGTHYTNLKVDLAAGQGPTVYLLDGPYIAQYASEDAIEDLTSRLQNIPLDDYYGFDAIKNADNEYYAVPQAIQVNVLYYNKDMFDAENLAYPRRG